MSTELDEILKAMEENSIEKCDLSNKRFTPQDAKCIADVLKRNTSVKELFMWINDIEDEGCVAIAQALRENGRLRWLNLRNCGIADKGLISIAESLKENFTLTELWIRNHWDEGATPFLDTLDVNMTLSDVDLQGTGVSDELRMLIRKKTKRNVSLKAKLEVFNASDLLMLVPFRKMKIILLGTSGSGKTHTVRELTSEEYVEERDRYTEALEINSVNSMSLKWEKDDQLPSKELSLASLRGQVVANEIHSHLIERGDAQIEVNRELRRVLDVEEEDKVAQRSSFTSHLRSLSKDTDVHEGSAERSIVADIYDFGGHEVYRVIQYVFMSDWAVYLIVLNLEDSLDELREQLSYYVSVVRTFAPEAMICVVGTHFTTIASSKEEVEEMVEEVREEVQEEEEATEKVVERIFYVENDSGSVSGPVSTCNDDKEALKTEIRNLIQRMLREKEPKVPLLWSRMLDILRRKKENEGVQVVKVSGLSEIELGRSFEKSDWFKVRPSLVKFPPEDIDAFIEQMKEMGMLYHFDTPEELSDFIILDPSWLVEGIKGVVTIAEAKKLKKANPSYATNPQWREFLGSGVLTSQLLELIASVYWKGNGKGNEEWKAYFLNLLQQQSLLYRIPGGIEGEEKYVVPPLLPKNPARSPTPMSEFLIIKLKRCYPPLEVYKLSFGLVKRKGWTYEDRSTRYGILLKKTIPDLTFLCISCDSFGMRQRLSISIPSKHLKSPLNKAVIDDLLSESIYDVYVKCPKTECSREDEENCRLIRLGDLLREETVDVECDGCASELVFRDFFGYAKEEDEVTAEQLASPRNVYQAT